jgi:hypothetical protein
MKADYVLQDTSGVPGVARRTAVPLPMGRSNGVAEPSTHRQVQFSNTGVHYDHDAARINWSSTPIATRVYSATTGQFARTVWVNHWAARRSSSELLLVAGIGRCGERGGRESDDHADERGAITDQPDEQAGNESSECGRRSIDRASGGVHSAKKLVRRVMSVDGFSSTGDTVAARDSGLSGRMA